MEESLKQNNIRISFQDAGFLFLSIGGGILTGLAFGIIGSFIYLAILFPLIMGAIGGNIISKNAQRTKIRSAVVITIVSILTAIAIYFAFHYMRYTIFWAVGGYQTFGDFSGQSLEAGKVVVDYALGKETGQPGFIGYMLHKALKGVSIGRIFRNGGLNLGPIFTWAYWLIEVGVIGFITISLGKNILKKRFCEHCKSWYTEKEHIGGTPISKEMEVLNSIKRKDFASVGATLEENSESPSLEFYLQSCKSCGKSDSFLSISLVRFLNGKLDSKDILETTMKPLEKKSFMEEIKFLKT
jgi:hypothetical protein